MTSAPASLLYPYTPPMPACDGCGECCGPVWVTGCEAEVIRAYIAEHRITWHPGDLLMCGFHDRASRKCRIYPVRPFGCRLFGVVREMPCPHYPASAVMSFPAARAMAEGWMEEEAALLTDAVLVAVLEGQGG